MLRIFTDQVVKPQYDILAIVKVNGAKPAKFQKEVIHGPPKFATNISTW